MSKIQKSFCIGHVPPLFDPGIEFVMLTPTALGMSNQCVIPDNRFGAEVDGGSLAEYSQLFWLYDNIVSGEILADELFLFQYRKFISPKFGGLESVAPWIRVVPSNSLGDIFPTSEDLRINSTKLAVGSLFDFGESIAKNYALVHEIDDLILFSVACVESGAMNKTDLRMFISIRGIIPSPAVCLTDVKLFLKVIEILYRVWNVYKSHSPAVRQGYQRRSAGYLLERLHSWLICKWLLDGSEPDVQLWNRYVVSSDIL